MPPAKYLPSKQERDVGLPFGTVWCESAFAKPMPGLYYLSVELLFGIFDQANQWARALLVWI